ncbi:MAG: [protein-PII] uridylyltransferase [Polyangiales bacterium]
MAQAAVPSFRETCRDYLATHRTALVAAIEAGQRGLSVSEGFARMYDGLLGSLCCAAAAEQHDGQRPLGRVALVAVGGYGRRLMAPRSDVDVLFLCDEPTDPRVAKLAESVLYPLWDVGVDIGHAVRGLEETLVLSESDIRTSTTLLDMRHVAGDKAIVQELYERGRKRIFDEQLERFLAALEADTETRHERFGDSLYVREPELKLGRGGLRDLDVIQWSVRARFEVESLEQSVEHGVLTAHEVADLRAAQEHLWTVRNRLHVMAGRRHDRVTYDDQDVLAAKLGYRDGMTSAVEQYLQSHFRHARNIARVVDCIGDRVRRSLRPPPTTVRDLGGGVLVHDRRVTFKRMDLSDNPSIAFRLYGCAARESLPPDPEARDTISAAAADREWAKRLRRQDEAATVFAQLLTRADSAPVRRGSLVRELHEVGLLLAMIPELEGVTGRVRHDPYHAYTVDAHAIMAVDRLHQLARGELAAEFHVVSRCAAEMPRPLPLCLALLLHGLGTGHPDDPAGYAAAIAGPVGDRLGLPTADVQHMQWLIAHQSTMYFFATRRDITDPSVISELAREVQTVHRLRDLFLFTFCQVSTENPTAMSAWNARMLDELWQAVSDHLEGRGGGVSAQLERIRRDVLAVELEPERRVRLHAFVASAPERYLLANGIDSIRRHAEVVESRSGSLAFGASNVGVGQGTLEVVLACDDRPGLLADLTAALAATRFSVDTAQLYTRTREGRPDEAFDIFHVSHPNMGDERLMPLELDELRRNIEQVLDGRANASELLGRRSKRPSWSRPGPKIKTEIHVDSASSPRFTIVDVYTRDRTDLLHVIARTLHEKGLTIALAKVNTEGQRVADVFYVQTRAGGKLGGAGQLADLSAALREVIHGLD